MWQPEYPVDTGRLLLRPFADTDFEALHDIQSRPDVARYMYWEPRSADAVRDGLDRRLTQHALHRQGDVLELAVLRKDSGALIGDVNLVWVSERHRQGELGYMLHPAQHGRGYATEAARAVLRLGFAGLGLHRITGRVDARNTASARVLERLGMRREAHLRENEIVKGEWTDELVYALLRTEWTAQPRPPLRSGPR
jgi:RimJ/RimL family protein N-acetyltransferase